MRNESTTATEEFFLALDGDDIGNRLEYFMLTNDISSLREFSRNYEFWLLQFKEKLIRLFDAEIIFFGGDNLLGRIAAKHFDISALEELRRSFSKETKTNLSIGIGTTPRESYIALNFAKVSGKNCTKLFKEVIGE